MWSSRQVGFPKGIRYYTTILLCYVTLRCVHVQDISSLKIFWENTWVDCSWVRIGLDHCWLGAAGLPQKFYLLLVSEIAHRFTNFINFSILNCYKTFLVNSSILIF